MAVKFKLGFTIDAETLFSILSKFLPIQDLVVEEVVMEQRGFDPLADRTHLPKPKRAPKARRRYKVGLHAGMNATIMSFYGDSLVHPSYGLGAAVKAAGYSPNGLFSKLERLCRHGYLVKVRKGEYQLTPKGKTAMDQQAVQEKAA